MTMRRVFSLHLLATAVLMLLFVNSCNEKPTEPGGGGGKTSVQFSGLTPLNGEDNQPLFLELRWIAPDTFDDTLSHSVFFGTTRTPPFVESVRMRNRWITGILAPGVTYYWRISVARVGEPGVISPLYSFTTTSSDEQINEYPLEVGSEWTYRLSRIYENVYPDSVRDLLVDTLVSSSGARVISSFDTTMGSEVKSVYAVEEFYDDGSFSCQDTVIFEHTDKHLLRYRSYSTLCSPSATPRATATSQPMIVVNNAFNRLFQVNSSLNLPDTTLEYQTSIGDSWRVYGEDVSLAAISPSAEKTVIGSERLITPAGEFQCMITLTQSYDGNDGTPNETIKLIDYISDIGLVRRDIVFYDISITTYEYPFGIGIGDAIFRLELLNYNQ